MPKIMEIIAKETNGKSYNTMKYSYDSIGIPSIDYDDDNNKIMKWQEKAETDEIKHSINLKDLADQISGDAPLISYFLDGSRHVYKVDDISYNNKVYPVVAGQIGVGCCKRVNKRMQIEQGCFKSKLVIALPKIANQDGWDDEAFFASKVKKINESEQLKRLGISFDKILIYREPDDKSKSKIEDNGIAVIQDYMMQSEKELVTFLASKGRIDQNNYLLKDGSLEYSEDVRGGGNEYSLQKIKHNYRWVIGVSKSFNPEILKDHKGKSNANYIADLPLYHRTPVAKFSNPGFLGDVQFGVWYLRIRDKSKTRTPFDGVVKVEKILMPEEEADGIDSEIVDLISANIINERTPTCYGTDRRWANHLYPVYLTESFIKSRYMSSAVFLNLF